MAYYVEKADLLHQGLIENGIECYFEKCHKTKFTVSAHIHTAVEMLYITKGEFTVYSDSKQERVFAGDLVLFTSNTVHSVFHSGNRDGRYLVIKVPIATLEKNFKGKNNLKCLQCSVTHNNTLSNIFRGAEMPEGIKEILDKMTGEREQEQALEMPMQKAYVTILLILIYRNFFRKELCDTEASMELSRDMRNRIHQSIEYINTNYSRDIRPENCARMINISYSYYAKLFKTVTGKTFKEYLISVRLAKAHIALIVTDLPIVEIALSYGFNNSAYFTSEFKRHYGVTPTEIRRSAGDRQP